MIEYTDFIDDDFSEFIQILKAASHSVIRRKKGELINNGGTIFDRYYFILSGTVRSNYIYKTGHMRTVVSDYKAGAIFPLFCPKGEILSFFTNFYAQEDTELIIITAEEMEKCLKENDALNREMYRCYNRLVNNLLCELSDHVFLTGMGIFSQFLIDAYERIDGNCLFLSQQEISEYIGINRSNIARYLKILRDDKAVETKRNQIIIKDVDEIRKYICDN